AQGHVAALNYLKQQKQSLGFLPINLGSGKGTSVLELVRAFSAVSAKDIPFQFVGRRAGDIASCYASADKAQELLGWKASLSITDMCQDTWRWQSINPNGYNSI
ncbi:UDP-glucose 4-epimerase GalE, partial [Psychrobacter sp. 16-Bac2893]